MEAAPAVFQAAWPVASGRFGVESACAPRCAPRCASNPRVLSTIAVGVWAVRLSPWSHSRRSRPRRAQSEDTAPTPEAPEAPEVPAEAREAPEETPTPEAPEAPVPAGSAESDAEFLAEFRKRVQEVNAKENARRERIDQHWRKGEAHAKPAAIIQDDWVRRVALAGDEVFIGTASSGIRRHVIGEMQPRQIFRVQGNPSRMVPADHQAEVDPETSITSLVWNGRYLFAGLAGGSLQVWNDDAWLLLDHDVGTRPCYLCVQDNILVAAAGDALMCWDINNLEDVPLYKTQAPCRVHCVANAFDGSIILGLADGSVELRALKGFKLLSRRPAAHGPVPVSAAVVSPEAKQLVTGDDAGRILCWSMDAQMPGEEWKLNWRQEHEARIVAINSGGGNSIITAALDGKIIAWDAETGESVFKIPNHKVWLGSICVSEERDLLVTDGRDNAVYLYDFADES